MGKYLPSYYRKEIGKFGVTKGNSDDDNQLYSWDAISDCLGDECACFEMCEYSKIGKCRLQLNYIKGITNIIYKNFSAKLDEPTCFRVGMHLIPLYGILCRLKMEEIVVNRAVHMTKGGFKIHPIYKEIRETIRGIENMWKNLGFNGTTPQGGFSGGSDDAGSSYYDAMEDGDTDIDIETSVEKKKKKETMQSHLRKNRDKSKHNPKRELRRSKE